MTSNQASIIGSTAVLLWGALALFTDMTAGIPPFQLVAMTFPLAFALAACKWIFRREDIRRHFAFPPAVWLLGIGGLFGYHFFYFMALKNAPAVDASLIAFLWPLLIVVFSALLPGERLRWFHLVGAVMGFGGSAILVTNGGAAQFQPEYALGYAAACACALTWSSYSVLSRRFAAVPTDTVGWFCGATAILGAVCHLMFEETVRPQGIGQWLAIVALGLGPVGIAFFAWDVGMKRGNIRLLGVFSYAAPLISVILLILFRGAPATISIAIACAAIVGGALLASLEILSGKGRPAGSPEANGE